MTTSELLAALNRRVRLLSDEVTRLRAEVKDARIERDEWQLEAQGCICGAHRVAECSCLEAS
jgi:hypothetical protein